MIKFIGQHDISWIFSKIKSVFVRRDEATEVEAIDFTPVHGIPVDEGPVEDSMNLISSGGVYDAMIRENAGAVHYDMAQTLTDSQKTQARTNIAAASASDVATLATTVAGKASQEEVDQLDLKVDELNNLLEVEKKAIDLTEIEEQNCSLGASSWFRSGTTGKHKAIPVTPGVKYYIKVDEYNGHTSGEYNGWYVFVNSSYSPPYSNGDSIPKVGDDYRIAAMVGVENAVYAPQGAAYLIITTQDGAGISPTWSVKNDISAIQSIEEDVAVINTELFVNSRTVVAGWGDWTISNSYYKRGFKICDIKAKTGGLLVFKLTSYTTYKIGFTIQDGTAWSSPVIYDEGWKTQDISYLIPPEYDGYNIRVTIGLVANASINSVDEFLPYIQEVSFSYTVEQNGLVKRVEILEDEQKEQIVKIPMAVLNGTSYVGQRVSFLPHHFTHESIGNLPTNTNTIQGGAVFGDFLFQCHNKNGAIVIYDLTNGTVVQTLSLTENAQNHANSVGFGSQYYDSGDPFPCLYVSSEGESKCYVYRITGTMGSYSISLVQTLSYLTGYYYPNIHIDAPNNRGIVVGYYINSWNTESGNKMMCCCFDLPDVTDGDSVLSGKYNEFSFPYIYATQGAFGKYGKLVHAFGNTQTIGGIIVVDYISHTVETFIDLKPIGTIEPEGIGVWGDSLVITTQGRAIYKLTFQD